MLAVDGAQRYVPRLGGVVMQRFYLKFDSAVLVMNVYSCESEEQLLLARRQGGGGCMRWR